MGDHLGGFVPRDERHPWGDHWTYLPTLWQWLLDRYHPATMVDVGCGEGHSTRWFLDHGVDAVGIDGSDEARQRAAFPPDRFVLHDFREPMGLPPCGDMVWCSEFVEHVEERHVRNFLEVFARAKVVAMTHAFPGQAGHHHVNCREPEYWIGKLKDIGMVVDMDASLRSRRYAPNCHWARSGLIFTREVDNG